MKKFFCLAWGIAPAKLSSPSQAVRIWTKSFVGTTLVCSPCPELSVDDSNRHASILPVTSFKSRIKITLCLCRDKVIFWIVRLRLQKLQQHLFKI
jgi:hypothetical protein